MQVANKLPRFWMVSRPCIQITICIDILFILLSHAIDSPLLAWVSVLSICIYAIAYAFLTRKKIRVAACLICMEVLSHAGLGTCLVGWDGGFHYFILMVVPVVFVSKSLWGGMWAVVLLWCFYIGMSISASVASPIAPLAPFHLDLVRYFNVTVVFVMFFYLFSSAMKRIKRMQNTLEEKLHQLSRFSSDIAHELRTPLTAICNQGEVAIRNPSANIDKKTRQFLEDMLGESFRLARMIDRLLAIAHVENHCITAKVSEHCLESIAREALCIMQVIADDRDLTLSLNSHAAVSAQVDADFLRQVLIDLLDNALKYAATKVSVRIRQDHEHVFVEVIDDGPGISPQNRDLMLQRFTRGDDEHTQKGDSIKSFGLGLSIALSLTEIQGGSLTLCDTSSEGVGSGLMVRLQFLANRKYATRGRTKFQTLRLKRKTSEKGLV